MESVGGSLRQLFTVGAFNVGGVNCNSGTDANPAAGATIYAGRLTTPLFGLGLVDAMPDSFFDTAGGAPAGGDRGIVNRVPPCCPTIDASAEHRRDNAWAASAGRPACPNLLQFSGDA